MDFTTTEAADDLGGLVRTITESVCTPERQRQLDGLEERFDRELWRKLIDADILSTAAPESLGGGGFGVLEQVAVLVGARPAAGRGALSRVGGARGGRAWPSSVQKRCNMQWATPAVGGEKILDCRRSTARWVRARCRPRVRDGGYRLTGTRTQVGYGPIADAFLVPAETDSGAQGFPRSGKPTPGSR